MEQDSKVSTDKADLAGARRLDPYWMSEAIIGAISEPSGTPRAVYLFQKLVDLVHQHDFANGGDKVFAEEYVYRTVILPLSKDTSQGAPVVVDDPIPFMLCEGCPPHEDSDVLVVAGREYVRLT